MRLLVYMRLLLATTMLPLPLLQPYCSVLTDQTDRSLFLV